MPRIVSDHALEPAVLQRMQALPGVQVQMLPYHKSAWELSAELLPDTEVLLCKVPPSNLDAMLALKYLQIATVGYEHLRESGFAEKPVRVCNARGVFDSAIAEWNVAMMINLTRDLRTMVRHQEHGVWDRAPQFQQEVRGKVVGLWGYGGIGRETARLSKALGLNVHVQTRSGVRPRHTSWHVPGTSDPEGRLPDRVYTAGQEQAFLQGLDFLILALPHARQNTGLVGERELRTLPPTAFVLNPARGPIIEEAALLRALREAWIAGAALDTHYAYPLSADHPLWRFPNVILTPHISGADKSQHFATRISDLFMENVTRYLEGEPLLNEISPEEWQEA